MMNIVFMIATGILVRNKSVGVNIYVFLYYFNIFLNTYELAKKLVHESPCLIKIEVNPVYKSFILNLLL
jgi:hypothetical protein